MAADAPSWVKTFRRGCTAELDANVVRLVAFDFEHVAPTIEDSLVCAFVSHCRDALKLCTGDAAKQLRDQVSTRLAQLQAAEMVEDMAQLCDTCMGEDDIMASPSLRSLTSSLAGMGNDAVQFHPVVAAKLRDLLEASIKGLVSSAAPQWDTVVALWALVQANPCWFTEDHQQLQDSIARYLDIAQPLHDFEEATTVWETASQSSSSHASLREPYQAVCSEYKEVLRATAKERPAAPPVGSAEWDVLWGGMSGRVDPMKGQMLEIVSHFSGSLQVYVQEATTSLARFAGGVGGGKHWWSSFEEMPPEVAGPLDQHFTRVWQGVDERKLSTFCRAAEEAVPNKNVHGITCFGFAFGACRFLFSSHSPSLPCSPAGC